MNASRALPAAVIGSLGFGALTIALLALGFGSIGGAAAFIHQCFVVGLPFALVVGDRVLRSSRTVVALSFAVSMAISAVAAQVLIMFSLADPLALVGSATLYGVALAQVAGAGLGRTARPTDSSPAEGEIDTSTWRDTRELAVAPAADRAAAPAPPQLHHNGRGATGRFLPGPTDRDADR